MKLAADYPIRCRCGQLQASLLAGAPTMRAVCYCRDCQAYAEALGEPGAILDSHGGTEVVASLQSQVRFTQGIANLACLSLTERGLLRWYARCCNTAIGNTPRDPRISYVGFVHTCLGGDRRSRDTIFGPPELANSVEHARGPVASSGFRRLTATLRIIGRLLRARLNGSWRRSPFFGGDLRPIVNLRVVNPR